MWLVLLRCLFVESRPLIGINYFAGWWTGPGDKWVVNGTDWRPQFPERQPLLGDYNTQQTMDAEILAAASTVDFFQILWYDNYPSEREPGAHYLNRGVSNFIASPYASKMSFYIEWCNSYPLYGLHDDNEWATIIQTDWMPAFAHPSYLRVGGRLIFKVINAGDFLQNCNGNRSLVTQRLDFLRAAVRNAKLGEMWIGGGTGGEPLSRDPGYKYDWTGVYGVVPDLVPLRVYPWETMSDYERDLRRNSSEQQPVPFVPVLMSGWNAMPWGGEQRPVFTWPTNDEFESDLRLMAQDVAQYKWGFPLPNGTLEPAFTIYAWNEFGEGGLMAPSVGFNYSRLLSINKVFGPRHTLSLQ